MRRYERWINELVTHEQIMCERFIESPIPHPTALLRRRTLVEVGGYQDRGWPEDYDLWLRMALEGKRFHKVTECLYYWREHITRLTRTDSRYAVEKFLACKARYLLAGPLRFLLSERSAYVSGQALRVRSASGGDNAGDGGAVDDALRFVRQHRLRQSRHVGDVAGDLHVLIGRGGASV